MATPARYERDGMSMREFLGLSALAERAGITPKTARHYLEEGRLPQPDVIVIQGRQRVRGWLPETIDHWMAHRPGQGARTDLREK